MGQVDEPEDDVASVITELQKGEGNDEALSRLFELLEMQKLQQQTLLSRLTKVTAYQENEARKQDIYKFMYDRNMRGLRPALEAMPADEMAMMRDQQGMSLCHHLVRTGLGPALEYVLGKAPSLADSATHPGGGNPANWTPIMVLVDAPPGSLGGVDYAYNMLKLLLVHMSATGIQILGLSVFVSFAFTMLFCGIVGINKA